MPPHHAAIEIDDANDAILAELEATSDQRPDPPATVGRTYHYGNTSTRPVSRCLVEGTRAPSAWHLAIVKSIRSDPSTTYERIPTPDRRPDLSASNEHVFMPAAPTRPTSRRLFEGSASMHDTSTRSLSLAVSSKFRC